MLTCEKETNEKEGEEAIVDSETDYGEEQQWRWMSGLRGCGGGRPGGAKANVGLSDIPPISGHNAAMSYLDEKFHFDPKSYEEFQNGLKYYGRYVKGP